MELRYSALALFRLNATAPHLRGGSTDRVAIVRSIFKYLVDPLTILTVLLHRVLSVAQHRPRVYHGIPLRAVLRLTVAIVRALLRPPSHSSFRL